MSLPDSSSSQREPTRELLLAQALDACIEAERHQAGSADEVIARQPAWAHAELRQLVSLAGSLDAAARQTVISDQFRLAARARLMERIGGAVEAGHANGTAPWLTTVPSAPSTNGHYRPKRLRSKLMWRGVSGGLLAAVLAVGATLTASASALPGEPLYSIKQAREELGVRLAPDDQARALVLLGQADARLDETARLLQQGRTAEVAETAQRFDQVVERATTTYVVTVDEDTRGGPTSQSMETRLSQQQEQLQALLQTAPEPARADLREALVTTERGRALVADPRPVERVLSRPAANPPGVAAAVPTMAAEDEPTAVPTPTQAPPPTATAVVVAEQQPAATPVVAVEREVEHEDDARAETRDNEDRQAIVVPSRSGNQGSRVSPPAVPARVQGSQPRDQGSQSHDQGRNQMVERDGNKDDAPPPAAPVVAENPQPRTGGAAQANGRQPASATSATDRGGDNAGADRGGNGDDRGGGGQPAQTSDDRSGADRGGADRGGGNNGDDRGGGGQPVQTSDDRGGGQPAQGGDARGRSADDARASDDASRAVDASRSAVARSQASPVPASASDDRGSSGGDRSKSGGDGATASPTARNGTSPQVVINQPGVDGNTDRTGRDGRADDLRPVLTGNPTPTPVPSPAPASAPLVKQAAATSTPTRRESGDSTSKNDSNHPSSDPPPTKSDSSSHDPPPAKNDSKSSSDSHPSGGGTDHTPDSDH